MAIVLANKTAIRHISLFANQEFNLGTCNSTLLKRISKEFLEAQERWRIRDLKRKNRVEELHQELDNCNELDGPETNTAKLIAERDGGYFKLETYIKHIQKLDGSYQRNLSYSWEQGKVDSIDTKTGFHVKKLRQDIPAFWTQDDGQKQTFWCNHLVEPQEVHDRNNTIADIREEFLSGTRRGPRSHERQSFHYYKTQQDFQKFIQKVVQKGLVKEPEPIVQKELYDFVGGFYYKVSFPKEKLEAERSDYLTKEQLGAIKLNQLATLGGAEVKL